MFLHHFKHLRHTDTTLKSLPKTKNLWHFLQWILIKWTKHRGYLIYCWCVILMPKVGQRKTNAEQKWDFGLKLWHHEWVWSWFFKFFKSLNVFQLWFHTAIDWAVLERLQGLKNTVKTSTFFYIFWAVFFNILQNLKKRRLKKMYIPF